MPTKLSIDGQLLEGLDTRGMTATEFSIVCKKEGIRGASKTVLNESFRDVKSLPNEVAVACWDLWTEINQMCQQFEPFKLDLSNGEQVHQWLLARRRGEVFSVVVSGLTTDGENNGENAS